VIFWLRCSGFSGTRIGRRRFGAERLFFPLGTREPGEALIWIFAFTGEEIRLRPAHTSFRTGFDEPVLRLAAQKHEGNGARPAPASVHRRFDPAERVFGTGLEAIAFRRSSARSEAVSRAGPVAPGVDSG
jgi:hypothetical protein